MKSDLSKESGGSGKPTLEADHIEDLKKAAKKMRGSERRAFQSDMALKYCQGSPRKTEEVFGWNRNTVELGLNEKRTGFICLGAHKACCGNKLWEEKHPEAAAFLFKVAESHSQQDPTFRTTLSFTRLTAKEALKQLRNNGFAREAPSPRTMADVLNRNGYRLRLVVKAKPLKKKRKRTQFSTTLKRRKNDIAGTKKQRG